MDSIQPTFAHLDLDVAIDKHPAIVRPDTPLTQAIAFMGSRRISCGLHSSGGWQRFVNFTPISPQTIV